MKFAKSKMTPAERALLEQFKKNYGIYEQGDATEEAEEKAAELMKSREGLTHAQALDEVLRADPALAKLYEAEG